MEKEKLDQIAILEKKVAKLQFKVTDLENYKNK
jgi:hypothetical protein